MKRIKKILLLLIMIMPIFVYALSYTDYDNSIDDVNNYINKYNDRSKYLIFDQKYDFKNHKMENNTQFTKGGLLSKEEFDISTINGTSYLATGREYWTLTGAGTNQYYIDATILSKNKGESSGIRVTEFIKNSVRVNGKGTYTNPWEFRNEYAVEVKTNSTAYGDVDRKSQMVAPNQATEDITLTENTGYMYVSNDCSLTKVRTEGNNKIVFKINRVTRDINCTINLDKRKIKVTYDCNGGTGSTSSQTFVYGSSYVLNDSGCTRPGYTQTGWTASSNSWNLRESGTWNSENGQRGVSNNKLVLKAVWKDVTKPKVTITATDNNTNVVINTAQTFTSDGDFLIGDGWINRPIKLTFNSKDDESGIKKIEWRWNAAGSASDTGNTYGTAADATGKTTETITAIGYRKAQWIITDNENNVLTVTCVVKLANARIDLDVATNGGSISGTNPIYAPYSASKMYTTRLGTTAATVPTATRTGYTFTGWYTQATGGSKVIDSSGNIQKNVSGWTNANGNWLRTNATDTSGTNKLYAQFDGKTYTIAYVKNGATSIGKTSDSCKVTNEAGTCTVTAPSITRSGFTIDGWSATASATTGTAVGANITLSETNNGKTYNALTHKGITITFNKNGNTSQTPSGGSANTANTLTQKCTIRNSATTCSVKSPKITMSGFTIHGYSTGASTYSGYWAVDTNKDVSANATWYAQTSSQLTATFTVQDTSAATTSATSASCYKRNGGTSCSITAPKLTNKTGYTVIGWNKTSTATTSTVASEGTASISAATTYYSITKKSYSSSFTLKDTAAATTSATSASCDAYNGATSCTLTAPTLSAKTGYTAVGWSETNGGTTKVTSFTSGKAYYSITYNNTAIAITFTVQDTSAATASATSVNCYKYNGATNCSVKAPTLTAKSGYTAVGWNTTKTATSSTLNSGATVTLSSATTYYSITYNSTALSATFTIQDTAAATQSGGTKSCYKYNGATSCSIKSPTLTAKTGYTAVGWNTTKTATSSGLASNTSKSISANATYYSITYNNTALTGTFTIQDTAAATQSGGTKSCYKYNGGTSCSITAPTLTAKTGYSIVGWNTTKTATSSGVNSAATASISANTTYYSITYKSFAITYSKGVNISSIGSTSGSCKAYNGATSCNVTLPTITPVSGYTSVGWGTSSGATSGTAAGSSFSLNAAKTLYANAFDKSKPTISVTAYNYVSSGNHAGTSTLKAKGTYTSDNTYTFSTNWVNYSVTFKMEISDTGSGLKTTTWYWNSGGSKTDTGNTYSGGTTNVTTSPFYDYFSANGYRKGKLVAVDNAGNTTTVLIVVKIDQTSPTYSLSNTQSSATATCSDGMTSVTGGKTVNFSGSSTTLSGTCKDEAGNTAGYSKTYYYGSSSKCGTYSCKTSNSGCSCGNTCSCGCSGFYDTKMGDYCYHNMTDSECTKVCVQKGTINISDDDGHCMVDAVGYAIYVGPASFYNNNPSSTCDRKPIANTCSCGYGCACYGTCNYTCWHD